MSNSTMQIGWKQQMENDVSCEHWWKETAILSNGLLYQVASRLQC
jgi:hypothetical protein